MKPILGIALLLTWFARCEENGFCLPLDPDHGGGHTQRGDQDSGVTPEVPTCNGPPGLYVEGSCSKLADNVRSYRPKYELWGDGATKERFIYLPPNTQIDTTNPDRWTFPEGTRLYKTFFVDGKRVETRSIVKTAAPASVDSWTFTAYAWSDDELSTMPANPAGESNVLGTTHDIPSQAQCKSCHTMPNLDAPNGFGAIQLNHEHTATSLRYLIDAGLLVNGTSTEPNVTVDSARIPGDDAAQAALGYVHANCGHCHGGPLPKGGGLAMWSMVGAKEVADEPLFKNASCQCLARWQGRSNPAGEPYVFRILSGHADESGIIGRMSVRAAGEQMPPIGTKVVDDKGVATVSAWIDSLAATCDTSIACPPPPAAPTAGTGATSSAASTAAAMRGGAAAPASIAGAAGSGN